MKEIKGKVKSQLKVKYNTGDAETEEVKREKELFEKYEREDWKSLKPHLINCKTR